MMFGILLSVHLVAVAFAYGAGFAGGETLRAINRADEDKRGPLWSLLFFFLKVKVAAFLVLLIAGGTQLWLKGMGAVDIEWVFWVKMGAVAISVGSTATEIRFAQKWHDGDDSAFRISERVGHLTGLSMTTAIVAAVFAFY